MGKDILSHRSPPEAREDWPGFEARAARDAAAASSFLRPECATRHPSD
jgi:hypothetical protein